MSEEPTWRIVLNWGCIIYFLGLPALTIFLAFTHIPFAPGTEAPKFLADFHFAVSALVAAVAGLNTFERKMNGRDAKQQKEEK
jgi:hypothetical protein